MQRDDFDFAGRTVVVTGGNGGIGQGIVDVFSERNANVVVADFAPPLNQRTTLGAGELLDIRTDITDRASIDAMVSQVMARFGRIVGDRTRVMGSVGLTRSSTMPVAGKA